MHLKIKGASGWADQLYLYPIVRYYVQHGYDITVLTNYPEVFEPLKVSTEPYNRSAPADKCLNYCSRKGNQETNIHQDQCILAGLDYRNIPFSLDFPPYIKNPKPSVLMRTPYLPTWCKENDNFVPSKEFFTSLSLKLELMGISVTILPEKIDLTTKEWYTLYEQHSMVICQSNSNMVMSELTNKPCLIVWNHIKSKKPFVYTVTPSKVIMKPENTIWCYDNDDVAIVCDRILRKIA